MGIFRRSRNDEPVDERRRLEEADATDDETLAVAVSDDDGEERLNRVRGPFDASEVDDEVERIDLGGLLITPVDGMQLRLELDQEQQSVMSAHAVVGDSGVQLQAFAAPRTLGVWPDIRTEIADSITAQGGTVEVVDGPLGRELAATIPMPGPDGRTQPNAVRFLGVDGPRWFLRAVVSGPAATDPDKAAPLLDIVRSTVVVRDDEARPPREAAAPPGSHGGRRRGRRGRGLRRAAGDARAPRRPATTIRARTRDHRGAMTMGIESKVPTPSSRREEPRGMFARLADRMTRSAKEDEAEELRDETDRQGATPICDLANREKADVCGTVRSVTLRPRADVPALVVEIYDGSRPLHLVWLGRREIAGIYAGVQLKASGRVSYYRGIPTMFNPFYTIVPKSG